MEGIPLKQKFPPILDSSDVSVDGVSSNDNSFNFRRNHPQDYRKLSEHQLHQKQSHFVDRRAFVSLIALVALQIVAGTLYKVSQKDQRYAYSTYASFTVAELGKLAISFTLYTKELPKQQSLVQGLRTTCTSLKKPGLVFKIATLAALYYANNQLMFLLFLRADPASINLLKAGSSAITALIWCIFMGRVVSHQQWIAIMLQACGLIVVQYDACKGQTVLAASAYGWILLSVLITAVTGVWNEQQLKTIPLTLHEQNIVMYAIGVLLNAAGHHVKVLVDPRFPRFFEGYTFLSLCVIAVNACFGIVLTAVYKYSNAIVKTLASAVTTVVLTVISSIFFGLAVTIVSGAGCVSVILSVILYALNPSPDNDVLLDVNTRKRIAAVVAMAMCGALAAFHFYVNVKH